MSIGIGKYLPDHVRWTLLTVLWVVLGIFLVVTLIELEPMPASSELREVSGIVAGIDEHSNTSGRPPHSYWLYVMLQGSGQRYRLDHSHAGGYGDYLRIRNSLRRGDRLTLLVEDHKAHGPRIWEIHRGGDKLLKFLTVFDAEWEGRLLLYGVIGLYLPLTVVGVLYFRRKFGVASGYTL